ncbi:MAG: glycosyltransferase [Hyphomonadaceae bacterium]|nr:glycosyltransferase [Hyphomonadaceae bacterium]MBY0565134.1 glycosyltransferase [Hyphomonadaceae bacterium]
MKRALILSQNFPPSSIASVHRCRHLAKHLPHFGWETSVLTIDEAYHKEPPDPHLLTLVPPNVPITRARAIPADAGRFLGVGDLSLRSYPFVTNAISSMFARSHFDAVFITGWPFYHMLMSSWIRNKLNTPVILDFQDPWLSAEGKLRPRWSKGGLAHQLAVWLEPKAVRHANWITSVSETQNAEMAARYPWLDPSRMSAIPIGGDPDDFTAMRASPPPCTVQLEQGAFNICYVGTFLPRAGSVVSAVFKGAAQLRKTHPDLVKRLRFVFVGTSNQPDATARSNHRVWTLADAAGVGDITTEHPGRVGYLQALSLLANANALLLLGSDEPHYTASKIYPALMAQRPYLSIFHRSSSSHAILSDAAGGAVFGFSNAAELEALAPKVADALERLITAPTTFGTPNPSSFAPYTANSVAGQFARVFDMCLS